MSERRCRRCGADLRRLRVDAVWCSDACRMAAQRASKAEQRPNTRWRRPDLRISYRKALVAVTPYVGSSERATFILCPLLTERQREALR